MQQLIKLSYIPKFEKNGMDNFLIFKIFASTTDNLKRKVFSSKYIFFSIQDFVKYIPNNMHLNYKK